MLQRLGSVSWKVIAVVAGETTPSLRPYTIHMVHYSLDHRGPQSHHTIVLQPNCMKLEWQVKHGFQGTL